MPSLGISLLKLYVPLVLWTGLGLFLGCKLPRAIPDRLGKLLFWVGVPVSILGFLRQADLSGSIWVAPLTAWTAILLGAGLAWGWICYQRRLTGRSPLLLHRSTTQGSFMLGSMVGNTGYLGYPVTLALIGPQYFAWALFYDIAGSTLGAYGLGVVLAARFSSHAPTLQTQLKAILYNPALWSFGVGLCLYRVPLPIWLNQGLKAGAWLSVALSLLLIGMRLSQLASWRHIRLASVSLVIKMLTVPLLLGIGLSWLGVTGAPRLVMVLQMAMPPAFATLVITEAYNLDRDLTVTTLAIGCLGLLVTLPIWLWLFPI